MDVQVQDISTIRKQLTFSIPAEQVDTEIANAYKKLAKTAKIKGFRPGKIPKNILERHYEPQMQEQVAGKLINDSYFKALVDHKIPAISHPDITESGDVAIGQSFAYTAEVEIKPEIEVKDYTDLKLEREKFVADPKAIDKKIEEMQASRSVLEVSKRKIAREGDFALIDFEGFVDGVPFAGGKGEDHELELGSGSFIPGFEDQVVGMKRDQEKEISVTFPEEYGSADLAGKPATFKVLLKEIKEKSLPKLDDEFAKGFGMDSVEQIRTKLDESYQVQEKARIENDLRERLINMLIEKNPCEVPEVMVADQLEYMLGNIRSRMQQQGISMEMLGMNEESFGVMYRDTAVSQVRGSLILEAVARQEGITLEDDDLDTKLAEIATMSNAPLETVKNYYAKPEARQGLLAQIIEEKTLTFLLSQSTIKDVAKEKLNPEDKKEKE
ncbi:MAG: trigger factor [Desulfuromonadales bacterium]|nr:trigger factor [Desulfuromonadales bacterium]